MQKTKAALWEFLQGLGKTFMLPVALLAGIGIAEGLLPLLRGAVTQVDTGGAAASAGQGYGGQQGPPHIGWRLAALRRRRDVWVPVVMLGALVGYATVGALTTDPRLAADAVVLQSLSRDELAAMRWVAAETVPRSRFLLVTGAGWPWDKTSEWFPALTGRMSVATVQGSEWLPNHGYDHQVRLHAWAQGCSVQAAACTERWMLETGTPFTHVYVPKLRRGQCCGSLLGSLLQDPRYQLVYDGPGAMILARVPEPLRAGQ